VDAADTEPSAKRPVVLVDEEPLLDDLLRLAAAAGCELERVADAEAARARWSTAPLLVLDARAAARCADLGLPRRPGVVVVTYGPPPDVVWPVALAVGAQRVVGVPDGEQWLVDALADAVEGASAPGRVLAVVGGRGGAGASVFAAGVAVTALRLDRDALLVDCDPLAGGLDLVLGAETEQGLRWPDLRLRAGRVAASSLHTALPGRERGRARLTLLSGAREGTAPAPDAVAAVLEAGRRAGETVVCDLPRDFGPAGAAVLDRADLAVLVVPAEVRACAAARLVAVGLHDRGVRTGLVVRGPAPGRLRPVEVADAIGVELLTSMRPEAELAAALDRGDFRPRPRGPLGRAAEVVLRALDTGATRVGRAAS
jgi:secretion/DNA translocation related CpaE-like protein